MEFENDLIVKIEKKYRDYYECHNCRLTFLYSAGLRNILKVLDIKIGKKEYWDLYARFTWDGTKCKVIEGKDKCEICGYVFKEFDIKSGDHIMPVSKGGLEFDFDNIQTVCMKCNMEKGAKIVPKGRSSWNRQLSEFMEEKNNGSNISPKNLSSSTKKI